MSTKQKIEIEVDIPSGYEATGEYRPVRPGEFILGGDGKPFGPANMVSTRHHIIIRLIEPTAIKACRALASRSAPNSYADPNSPLDLARRAIAEYEQEQKP